MTATTTRCAGCKRHIAADTRATEPPLCFDCATLTEKVEARMRDDYGPLRAMLIAQGKIDPGCVR